MRSASLVVMVLWAALARSEDKLPVLIVDGINNHDWQTATRELQALLLESGRFTVEVSTSPPADAPAAAWNAWNPDFARYRVIVNNFNGGHTHAGIRWPRRVEQALEEYVSGGSGLVVYHAANNAFLDWRAYNDMIGLGWRDKSFGPGLMVTAEGQVVSIPQGAGLDPGHGPRHSFEVHVLNPRHPVTRGLPRTWMQPSEQLTHGQHGPAEGLTVLTYAYSEISHQNEPLDWVRDYGKGRVYTTMLGHTWKDEPNPNLECPAFRRLFAQGVEWAAGGKPGQFQTAAPSVSDEERIRWFRNDKFGMFIHWGPYSLLAGEWKGHRVPVGSEAEWIMQRFNIPAKEYREMARGLHPIHFNATEWVGLAKRAGMKYLVITAKHHDGFAMYHSRASQYNIVDWAGFQRDPLQELSEACAAAGIRFCVYYSHREDWDDPDGYGNNWDYDRSQKNFERYLERKSKPQLRELLTNYGPLGLIWFDRGMDTREHALQFVNLVRTLQPSCLINGRVGGYGEELLGDYQDLNDNGMPTGGLEEYWETPQTLNTTWGYSKFDQQWKSPGNVIQRLVEIVSKGGNYLLNIGPMADGTVPAPSVQTLEKVGPWMRQNGESIYGTSACPLPEAPWGRCTVKGRKIYFHVFSWPGDAVLRISGFDAEVAGAYLLAEPSRKLPIAREHGGIALSLPARCPDEIDTVVVLELGGPLLVDPPIVTQGSDSPFELDYLKAVTAGRAVKRFNRAGKFHISKWTGPHDSVAWHLLVSQTGRYKVTIRYSARKAWENRRYIVAIGGQSLTGVVGATGEGYQYKTFDLGYVQIPKAGEYTLSIRPAEDSDQYLMYFQSLLLEPVGVLQDIE
jgi:alpha-L-fucosidase